MKVVAMLPYEKACVACGSMPTFFFLFVGKKKKGVGSRKTCACARGFGHKRKKKRALRAFWSPFTISFSLFLPQSEMPSQKGNGLGGNFLFKRKQRRKFCFAQVYGTFCMGEIILQIMSISKIISPHTNCMGGQPNKSM